MKEKIVITGGAGFIGSHIAEECVARGFDVKIIDNLKTGSLENLAKIKSDIVFVEGDILDLSLLEKEFVGAVYVIHQAALVSVPESIKFPLLSDEINAKGTLNVFEAARRTNVKRVVYASSSAVYGNPTTFPISEKSVCDPLSPYAAQKFIAEKYARVYSNLFDISFIGFRYFNVFGPRQRAESSYAGVIPRFVKALISGESVHIFGDGSATRDFVFVKDVASVVVDSCHASLSQKNEVLNIGSGKSISVNDTAALVNKVLNIKSIPCYEAPREGDIAHSLADITKAKELLGFSPRMSFEEGLSETVVWYKDLYNR